MNYTGKLYGKYRGKYFDTELNSEDIDKHEKEMQDLRKENEQLKAELRKYNDLENYVLKS